MGACVKHWTETGIRRRCRALASAGWNPVAVSKASGIPVWVLDRLMQAPDPEDPDERLWVTWGWGRFCEAYERLSALPVLQDAPLDYPPPMVWDDIDDEDDCKPVYKFRGRFGRRDVRKDSGCRPEFLDVREAIGYSSIEYVAERVDRGRETIRTWGTGKRIPSAGQAAKVREILDELHEDAAVTLHLAPGVELDRVLFSEHVRKLPYPQREALGLSRCGQEKFTSCKNRLPDQRLRDFGRILNDFGHPYRAQVNDTRKWYE